MQKVVIIVVLFCGYLVPSALANNVTTDDGNGLNIPTGIPTLTDPLPTQGVKEAWNKSINNFTHLFYETCNITSCNPLRYKHCYHDKVAQLIIHAIAVILGVVFAFFGYRLFKITLFGIGALVGGLIAYYVTYNYLSSEDHAFYISLGVAIAFGAICGVLIIILYYIGIFLAGAALGGIAAWFVLSIIDIDYLQEHRYIPILILVAVAIVFGIIALFIQKWLVMFATPVIGGLLITAGIDYFLELGRMMQYAFNVMRHIPDKPDCWYSWSMLGVFAVIIIAGILVQLFVTGRKYDHKKDMQGWFCFGLCNKKKPVESDIEMTRPKRSRYRPLHDE